MQPNIHTLVKLTKRYKIYLLDFTCSVRLHTLLHVVACRWDLLHPFAHQCNTDYE